MSSITTTGIGADLTQNRGHQIDAICCTLSCVATLAVGMRLFVRYHTHAIGLGDWLMLASLVLLLLTTGLIVWYSSLGGFQHLAAFNTEEFPHVLKIFWILQPSAIVALALAKASIGYMLLRIIGFAEYRWQKRLIYFLVISVLLFNLVACILLVAQCDPIKALWTPGLTSKCWNPSIQDNYAIFDSAWNAAVDLILALLPITIISKLKLSMKKKFGLSVVLSLEIFTSVCAAIKTSTVTLEVHRGSDITWGSYSLIVWLTAEMFLLIVLGSIPSMKGLFDRWTDRGDALPTSYELPSNPRMKDVYQIHSRGIDNESANGLVSTDSRIESKHVEVF